MALEAKKLELYKCQEIEKWQTLLKNAKIRDVKILQDNPLRLEIIQ